MVTKAELQRNFCKSLEANDVILIQDNFSDDALAILASEHSLRTHAILSAMADQVVARNLFMMLSRLFLDEAKKIVVA